MLYLAQSTYWVWRSNKLKNGSKSLLDGNFYPQNYLIVVGLTLLLPIVTKTEFLLKTSKQSQVNK